MYQSYEALDRPGGFSQIRLFAPLEHRNYRRLVAGTFISLIGDGVFLVALAWQVYALSDAPTALATVGIAMCVPTICCLLIGGAASDRASRRTIMLIADTVRAFLLAGLAVLSVTGTLRLWQLFGIAAIYGAASAFYNPAGDAIVPELIPGDLLAQANALDQLIRPIALRLAGPALGGFFVAWLGTGGAFGLDGASFVVSAMGLLGIRGRRPVLETAETGSVAREIVVGMRYVKRHPWLWATLISAAIAYLLFMGPTEVLLPFIVKNNLHGGAGQLGIIFAVGGLGSLLCAMVVGQRGLPRRMVAFMYLTWTVATFSVVGYGLAHALWGFMLASVAFNTLETAGTIAWGTIKQREVPPALLGRVSSLDWLISIGLLPVSYALTGPISAAIGPRATLVAGGVLGGLVTGAVTLVPGVLAPDGHDDRGPASSAVTTSVASRAGRQTCATDGSRIAVRMPASSDAP